MRTYRLTLFVPVALAVLVLAGCGNNDSAKTEAEVVLSTNSTLVPLYAVMSSAFPTVSGYTEVVYPTLVLQSKAKSPSAVLSSQEDAILNQWVVTCSRSDGGTVASPSWQNFVTVYVPAGGTTSLSNFPIFPEEYFKLAPLSQLFPENGGYDRETNKTNIRQRLHVEIFGKTVAGKNVSVAFDVDVNFAYL
jgi:hypothetical protein